MAPMTRCMCDRMGTPTDQLREYYVARARGGIGLIIVESAAVNAADALGYVNGCQMNRQRHADAWAPIVDSIHKAGAKVWIQLFHAGRLTVPEICGSKPIAPSSIKPEGEASFWRPEAAGQLVHFQTQTAFQAPREMQLKDIDRVIEDFANACRFALAAGFDGIEIHGAHGYLIHEFCSKYANSRLDDYGFNNEFLFSRKVLEQCRREIPQGIALSYRLSSHMIDNYYLRISDMALEYLIPMLDRVGVDVFHSSELRVGERIDRSGLALGESIKSYTNKPIIGCGGIWCLEDAQNIMNAPSVYDLIAIGRSLIVNRELPIQDDNRRFEYKKDFFSI